ncbi:IMPACT family protein [Ornithinimicrobium sediminis]|uniref:IMPACT family protein n=1 Tax=Ornithinimicrobium sediminis TaxID=2904603 RepID=UPI001E5FB9F6|nr:YigZ family protein [Ornithinimicrobium sediminis]MCE0487472.1 YigZ family protein [Ornithinimicrobium sediminis]
MAPESYRTPARPVEVRTEERRSVFVCRLEPVRTEASAWGVVEAARARHGDAGHHCSAFLLGPGGTVRRSSDDGEPGGTAGMPMLEVLDGAGLSDVVAVVSRWFGGVLLGTGGLVRAYGGAVRAAVAEARVVRRTPVVLLEVVVGHEAAGRLEHDLRARGTTVHGVDYAAEVTLRLAAAQTEVAALEASVAALTSGQARCSVTGTDWVDLPD